MIMHFRVRLNCIDHYQATPSCYDPQLRNDIRPSQVARGPKVPVVRIFGSTETGQKVCAHVHGAFPYLYVEYQGGLASDEVGAFIYRLHLSIDHALAVSYRRDQYGDSARFVARITLVKGIPFYGFHVGYRFFLKIYMFNPVVMSRLADLLQQGVIMKQQFQPYEAHLQYLLQFMIDYNLYGCSYLDSSKTNFRSPVPDHEQGSNSSHLWHSTSISPDLITDDPELPRMSHCSIEVDISVQSIANRKMVKERRLHHDFIERSCPIPSELRLVHSMAGLWRDETKRRRQQMPAAQQGNSPFPAEALVSMSADCRDSQPQKWIHEEEYREDIHSLVTQDIADLNGVDVNFDNFTKPAERESDVNTALQSVEDLYPHKLMPVLGLPATLSQSTVDPASSIEVDETKARQVHFEGDELFDVEDDDVLREAAKFDLLDGPDLQAKPRTLECSEPVKLDNDEARPYPDIFGVSFSMLKSKKRPVMPVYEALLDAAGDLGLVFRANKPKSPEKEPQLKRKRSEVMTSSPISKQLKQEPQNDGNGDSIRAEYHPTGRKFERSRWSRSKSEAFKSRKSPSQTPDGSQSNHTLNFAIVKDHHDIDTKLRFQKQAPVAQTKRDYKFRNKIPFDPTTSSRVNNYGKSQLSTSLLPFTAESSASVFPGLRVLMSHPRYPTLAFATPPPTLDSCVSMEEHDLPPVIYQDAYYSVEKDAPERTREYAGREYRLHSKTLPYLPDFDPTGAFSEAIGVRLDVTAGIMRLEREQKLQQLECRWRSWEFAAPPPSRHDLEGWLGEQTRAVRSKIPRVALSQIDGPTPRNKHGFKYSQRQKVTSVEHEVQYMSTMSLEIHVNTRGKFVPNPEEDEIQCMFWSCKSDEKTENTQQSVDALQSGIVVLGGVGDAELGPRVRRLSAASVVEENSELDLIIRMVEIVRSFDPDVLTGFEVHGSSWGYVIERARHKYDYNLCDEFSRMKTDSHGRFGKSNDRWGFNTTSTIRITGRHTINIWRAMQSELNLLQYTMENVAWHLLHRRVPHYSWKTLSQWYMSGKTRDLSKVLRYYQARARLDIQILEANELIPRTSEQARLLGVDFFSVFSRGSQFKVESIMFRIAKPENFILVSPSRKQVGGQNALECLPLVMEPQSAFYTSPVLVLDFQSLYPSVMIAYNYCYSTFLGRINNWRESHQHCAEWNDVREG
ncbi:hypothetical protein RJ55_05935 [Drechmeria coniospora]|nr:hypothetical protein RJ55_05935 [Drechmeria coniospora]